jgi:hypothetical protein
MSEGDEVVRVPEGEYSLAILLLTVALVATELSRDGEEVFEDLRDSFSDLGGEVVEDEVRVYFLDRFYSIDVVSEHGVSESEVSGGTVRQVCDNEGVWVSSSFMDENQIAKVCVSTSFH